MFDIRVKRMYNNKCGNNVFSNIVTPPICFFQTNKISVNFILTLWLICFNILNLHKC